MKTLLASALLSLAACGGGARSSTANQPSTPQATVDPTVPSWLPPSCIAYHKAVVQAIDCQAVDHDKRDEIQRTFDATSIRWKAENNADQARVGEIAATCRSATESVRTDIGVLCV